jgi:Leucine-rich repeat (LRR) protein
MPDLTLEDVELEIAKVIETNSDTLELSYIERGTKLPKSLLGIPNLRHLSITYSYFVDIPSWLCDIRTLETIELEEGGNVSEFMSTIGKLKQLRKLKIAYMKNLSEFPQSVKNLYNLKELNIDGADFESLPKEILLITNLESLSYIHCECELSDFFDKLAMLPNLKILNMSHFSDDYSEALPSSFIKLQRLEELHFPNWQHLNSLPDDIHKLQNLRVIDISNSDIQCGDDANIQNLPESIGYLPHLEVIDIFGCQDLKQLPASFARISTLKEIDIIDSGITELRLTKEQWSGLESLRMQGFPPNLSLCANLKNFAWHTCGVSIVGSSVHGIEKRIDLPLACLHNLENLHLQGGRLDSLNFLESMPKLRGLHLSCNFDRLPEWLCKLNNLEYIDIWGAASLKNLPACIADMESLKELHVYGSGVQTAPDFLKQRKDMYIDIRKGT